MMYEIKIKKKISSNCFELMDGKILRIKNQKYFLNGIIISQCSLINKVEGALIEFGGGFSDAFEEFDNCGLV
jgi:hypothetical protein